MGLWPFPCPFDHGSFLLWASSQEISGPWGSQCAVANFKDPCGKKNWEGMRMSSSFPLGWEWELWEPLEQSFSDVCFRLELTTKSSHMPWGQQIPSVDSGADKSKLKKHPVFIIFEHLMIKDHTTFNPVLWYLGIWFVTCQECWGGELHGKRPREGSRVVVEVSSATQPGEHC